MLKMIAAAAKDRGIGRNGKLLFSIPEDLRRFKELTLGNTVIMGRETLDSLPGGRPLPGRRNLVLTQNISFVREGVEVFHSVEQLLSALSPGEEAWVIGGASVYEQFLTRCEEIYLTEVDAIQPADRFFPVLDCSWRRTQASQWKKVREIFYRFCRYERIK